MSITLPCRLQIRKLERKHKCLHKYSYREYTLQSLGQLLLEIEKEAKLGGLSIDKVVYEKAGRNPETPILYAGNLNAKVAFLARDLGRDEVLFGEPLVGGAGRKVRSGVCKKLFGEDLPTAPASLRSALDHILLTNTVPYKPEENKAYPHSVRKRFRPFIARFLVRHWQGNYIITLGTEAFLWFEPYAEPGAAAAFWKRDDKYEASFACTLVCEMEKETDLKNVTIMPLPHPSPLNRKYLPLFPGMLEQRLNTLKLS